MKRKLTILIILFVLMSGCGNKRTARNVMRVTSDKDISMNHITYSIKKIDTRKEVKPKKPSGYYHYYEENDGYFYYVISGKAINESPYNLNTENILVQGTHGKKTYEGKLFFSNSEESDFIKVIKSQEQLNFYFTILVKDGTPLPDIVKIYYMKDFQSNRHSSIYDDVIIWTLPS